MEEKKIGFIGFGEVGKTFAREMRTRGAEVYYYDVIGKQPGVDVPFLPLPELISTCGILLSTVSTHVAVDAAKEASAFLSSGKIYADMNSTSASVKKNIAAVIGKSGASFVEGAILSLVAETGPRASILVAGPEAEAFSGLMNRYGLVNLKYFSPRIGEASVVKMIRSVFSKGVECLLLEMLIAGRRAGVEEYLWKDIVDFMTRNPFRTVAENWIKSHPRACERRYHEMVQVMETLEDLNVPPTMTRGTEEFFRRSVEMGLASRGGKKPDDFREVPEAIERGLQAGPERQDERKKTAKEVRVK
jgi:3-hydroxyisobutyrate dehydrogenase-like beta-hydroxyacid dehydrogenase